MTTLSETRQDLVIQALSASGAVRKTTEDVQRWLLRNRSDAYAEMFGNTSGPYESVQSALRGAHRAGKLRRLKIDGKHWYLLP